MVLAPPNNGGSTSRLGRYELVKETTGSGVAASWVARTVDARSPGQVRFWSILRLHRHVTKNLEVAESFVRETRRAQKLRHPNVTSPLEMGLDDGEVFVVSDYVEGETLAAMLAAAGTEGLPVPILLRIATDVLEALSAAHRLEPHSLVHGEISPWNIQVGRDGTARLSGFGVAGALSRIGLHGIKGHERLSYAAPERLEAMTAPAPLTDRKSLDPRSDLFSISVILWEGIARKKLFASRIEAAVVQKVASAPIPPLTGDFPDEVAEAVALGLQRDLALRVGSAAELIVLLRAAGPEWIAAREDVAALLEALLGDAMAERRAEIGAGDASPVATPLPTDSHTMPYGRSSAELLGLGEEAQPEVALKAPKPIDKGTIPFGRPAASMLGNMTLAEARAALEDKGATPKPGDGATSDDDESAPDSLNLDWDNPLASLPPVAPTRTSAPPAKASKAPVATPTPKPAAKAPPPKPAAKAPPPKPATKAPPPKPAKAGPAAPPKLAAAALPEPAAAAPPKPAVAPPKAASSAEKPPPPAAKAGTRPAPPKAPQRPPAKPVGPPPARKSQKAEPSPSDLPLVYAPSAAEQAPKADLHAASPAWATRLHPGTLIDRYELLLPVSQRDGVRIWAARARTRDGTSKVVFLKLAGIEGRDGPALRAAFLDEARTAARACHPNVAEILDYGEEEGVLFVVTEWIDGELLATLVREAKPKGGLPAAIAIRIVSQVCAGLHAIHELDDDRGSRADVVHGALGLASLLVTTSGTVKIAEIGLSAGQHPALPLLRPNGGDAACRAPEEAAGAPPTALGDLYAVGAILFVLLTGEQPSASSSLSERLPGANVELAELVSSALSIDPKERPSSAEAMKSRLDDLSVSSGAGSDDELAAFVVRVVGDRVAKRAEDVRTAIDDRGEDSGKATFTKAPISTRGALAKPQGDPNPKPAPPAIKASFEDGEEEELPQLGDPSDAIATVPLLAADAALLAPPKVEAAAPSAAITPAAPAKKPFPAAIVVVVALVAAAVYFFVLRCN